MSVVEIPQVEQIVKKGRGRPKKIQTVTPQPPSPVSVVETPVVPKRNELMLNQARELDLVGEAGEVVVKPSRKKYGNKQEVWDGLYESTKSGLRKEDLALTKNNKVVSHKQLKALELATKRIMNRPLAE